VTEEDVAARREKRVTGQLYPTFIASSFANTTRQMKHAIEKFRRDQPDVASYLDAMNTKMDLLVGLLLTSHANMPDHPSHDVNVSASGSAFRTLTQLDEDQLLELSLMFFPSFLYMTTYGTVLRSKPASSEREDFPFETAIEFEFVDESEQELLIRHVLQKESELLREARAEPVSQV
jgi:hypothetical protein